MIYVQTLPQNEHNLTQQYQLSAKNKE